MVRLGSAAALVGRALETAHIQSCLELSRDGAPQFSCLVGEAGIGKSRLLTWTDDLARSLGARVLRGSCIAGGTTLPFLPLLEAMRELAAGPTGSESDRAVLRAALSPGAPRSAEADELAGRARLLESIASLLADDEWTVLLLDDLQWSDASTAACIEFLTQRVRTGRLMLLTTSRDEPDTPPLVADGRRLARVDVTHLSEVEVIEQVAGVTGRPLPRRTLEAVVARAGGNPFVVEELLAQLGRDGRDIDSVPASVEALLGNRLRGFTPATERVLECLAFIDRPAAPSLLADIIGGGSAIAAAGAMAVGLVDRDSHSLRLRHPLYGEMLRARVDESTARTWHARIADALPADDAAAGEIAHHRWSAGDDLLAFPAVIAAAGAAEGILAFDEAAIELDRAVELAARLGPERVDAADARALQARAAHAHWLKGDASTATSRMVGVLADDQPADVEHWYWLAVYAWDAGDVPTSLEAFAHVAEDGSQSDDLAVSRTAFARARLAAATRRYEEAASQGVTAAAAASRACAVVDESSAHHVTGMALMSAGEVEEGLAELRRGLELGIAASSPWRIGMGYVHLAAALHLDGRLHDALTTAEEGVSAAIRLGLDLAHASDLRARAADVLLDLGDWQRADELTEVAMVEPTRAYLHLVRATLEVRRGRVDAAMLQLEAAASREGQHATGGPGSFAATHLLRRAEVAERRGDRAQVILLTSALLEGSMPSAWELQARLEGEILALRGHERGDELPALGGSLILTRAMSRGLCGDLEAERAAEHARALGSSTADLWSEVAQRWHRRGMAHRCARARIREAEAALQRGGGGRRRAASALRLAVDAAAAMTAGPLVVQATELATRAGIDLDGAPPRPPRDASMLTARELDVLRLLAEGMTNRQIAATLFVSVKTAGVHVTRILTKLDAHTRGEAVAVASRRGMLDDGPSASAPRAAP